MNARNLRYIRTKNSSDAISLADSKLKTKNFLSTRWIPFAETYATLWSQQELNNFSFESIKSDYFVIKPNEWSQWKWILIVKKNKDAYKQENKIIYSFHAPEVKCIGKGKLNKSYEFGNKVSLAVSGRGNFILAVKSFHQNPYDGHTLDQTIESLNVSINFNAKILSH